MGERLRSALVRGAEGNANVDRVEVRATVETDAGEERCETSRIGTNAPFAAPTPTNGAFALPGRGIAA